MKQSILNKETEIKNKYVDMKKRVIRRTTFANASEDIYTAQKFNDNINKLKDAELDELTILYSIEHSKLFTLLLIKSFVTFFVVFILLFAYDQWIYEGVDPQFWSQSHHLLLILIPTVSSLLMAMSKHPLSEMKELSYKMSSMPTRRLIDQVDDSTWFGKGLLRIGNKIF